MVRSVTAWAYSNSSQERVEGDLSFDTPLSVLGLPYLKIQKRGHFGRGGSIFYL